MSYTTQTAASSRVAGWWETFPTSRSGLIAFAVVASLIGLGYSLFTEQIWEDSLITLRHSENLLKGDGLVYNPGQRVHGFTSPVNVLLLTLCHLMTGQSSYMATFWLYRVFTIAAFAGGGVLLLRAMANTAPRWAPAIWLLGIVYLFDSKSVSFSTNGMETGFMLLLIGWAVCLLTQGPDRWVSRGLCWAGLMWTRPDGCVYIAALAAAEVLFLRQGFRRATLGSLLRSAGLGVLLYSPWFLWAWSYYGSPIPHTVIAKANAEQGTFGQLCTTLDIMPEVLAAISGRVFRPIQMSDATSWLAPVGWARFAVVLSKAVGLFSLLYWLFPVRDGLGRASSFCFAILCFYFCFHPLPYLWYYPPAAMFGMVALARGLTMLATRNAAALGPYSRLLPALALVTVTVLAIGQIALFCVATRGERIWQQEIENGNRAVIGTWLKENGKPGETVYLEPLGYIGYFSGMKMMDYPGLVAPQVVQVRREKKATLQSAIRELKPDWVVLRFWEFKRLDDSPYAADFKQDYHAAKVFNVNDKLNEYGQVPDNSMLRYDAAFAVFRKNASPGATPSSALPPAN